MLSRPSPDRPVKLRVSPGGCKQKQALISVLILCARIMVCVCVCLSTYGRKKSEEGGGGSLRRGLGGGGGVDVVPSTGSRRFAQLLAGRAPRRGWGEVGGEVDGFGVVGRRESGRRGVI